MLPIIVQPDDAGAVHGIEARAVFAGAPHPGVMEIAGAGGWVRRGWIPPLQVSTRGRMPPPKPRSRRRWEEVEDVADLEEEQEGLPGGGVEEVGTVDAGEGRELRDLVGAELVHEGKRGMWVVRRWKVSMVPSWRVLCAVLQEDLEDLAGMVSGSDRSEV